MWFEVVNYCTRTLWRVKCHSNLKRITDALHEDQYTFMIISSSFLLIMRSVSLRQICRRHKTHILFSIFFCFENLVVCEIMWKNVIQPDRPQMTIWRMCIAWRICKATVTHLEYVIITAFQLQQWLHERASMLRYM
jgi:hypothetical protein